MKKIYVVLISVLVAVIVIVACSGAYIKFALPRAEAAPVLSIDHTADRVERGRYLAYHVAVCMDCHSTRDWSRFGGPMAGNPGGGGERFGKEMDFPGTIYSANITPANLGNWTDGELFRAITTGVNKQGKALFPLMPYHRYGQMDKEDIYSIIAYIRTLQPIENKIPERELDFPLNFLVNTMPSEAKFSVKPDESNTLAYGKYLVNMASCVDCHSRTDKGAIIPGSEFGGGREFAQPAGKVCAPNITPHIDNGIGQWTMQSFVQRFKQYTDSNYHTPQLGPGDLNSPMPWHMYAGMKESDLQAIYTYLQSLAPIDNAVTRYQKK